MKSLRSLVFVSLSILMFSSCGTSNLYYWGTMSNDISDYERAVYSYYKYQSPESVCRLIETYQDIINTCKDNEKMIPPGICAEFGYVLLNPDNEAYFNEYATKSQKNMMRGLVFMEYGREMMEKEIALYPEARKFLEPVIERIKRENKED